MVHYNTLLKIVIQDTLKGGQSCSSQRKNWLRKEWTSHPLQDLLTIAQNTHECWRLSAAMFVNLLPSVTGTSQGTNEWMKKANENIVHYMPSTTTPHFNIKTLHYLGIVCPFASNFCCSTSIWKCMLQSSCQVAEYNFYFISFFHLLKTFCQRNCSWSPCFARISWILL